MLLGMQMDDEGYVLTHQHFSHAHDHGWPFPLWTQSDNHPDRVEGKTFGWHFQPLDKVPGWVGDALRHWGRDEYCGEKAASLWELHNVRSLGIRGEPMASRSRRPVADDHHAPGLCDRRVQRSLSATAMDSRQGASKGHCVAVRGMAVRGRRRVRAGPPRLLRSREDALSRRVLSLHHGDVPPSEVDRQDRADSNLPGPGRVAAGTSRSIRSSPPTTPGTRSTIPIFILASARYFAWTGDLDFLRQQINRMRLALRYQQTVMGGLEHKHIRNTWPGHDGLPGFVKDADGKVTIRGGHGIGSNYWDLMPFGWDDLYATNQYYAATVAMAEIEAGDRRAIRGGACRAGRCGLDPKWLRDHAAEVKRTANALFWNGDTGRFFASIDKEGHRYDYGYTFLNLDSIWYGLADATGTPAPSWTGSQASEWWRATPRKATDIYHWRFGPRATTLRNVDWYGQGWHCARIDSVGRPGAGRRGGPRASASTTSGRGCRSWGPTIAGSGSWNSWRGKRRSSRRAAIASTTKAASGAQLSRAAARPAASASITSSTRAAWSRRSSSMASSVLRPSRRAS